MDGKYNLQASGKIPLSSLEMTRGLFPLVKVGLIRRTHVFGKQLDVDVHSMDGIQTLMEDELGKYQSHFSEYIKVGVKPDNTEELFMMMYSAICADLDSN
ncbi:hypothetical protein L6452_36205 [Arctium lappa]|uniref:Uncharacterized protein n=1 Tax=Arctium lappa TaxID=4217 RepID=A0ACB8Y7X9_ARCLA|nr:hypothetical protein L6452_36205 [Arctium lappa]